VAYAVQVTSGGEQNFDRIRVLTDGAARVQMTPGTKEVPEPPLSHQRVPLHLSAPRRTPEVRTRKRERHRRVSQLRTDVNGRARQ